VIELIVIDAGCNPWLVLHGGRWGSNSHSFMAWHAVSRTDRKFEFGAICNTRIHNRRRKAWPRLQLDCARSEMVCFSCEIECGGVAVLVCVTVWVWRVWPVSSHRRDRGLHDSRCSVWQWPPCARRREQGHASGGDEYEIVAGVQRLPH
jgi:hypothetical protein